MKRLLPLISIIAILAAIILVPKKVEKADTLKADPGFNDQWFEWKKDINGEIPANKYSEYMAHDQTMMGIWNRRANENPIEEVIELGPTEVAGRTRGLLAHPDNDNIIFAGGISGGLWKTVDKGANWAPINDHQASLMVSSITMNPFNKNEIYYGTGESRANSASVNGDGIFKSTDGGKTFTQLPSTKKTSLRNIWTIKHSLVDSSTIYAGVNSSGVYISKDKGVTWAKFPASFGSIVDIEVFKDGTVLCGEVGSGVYKITPGSTVFKKMTLPNTSSYQRVEIEKCIKYPNVVYAALEGSSTTHNVLKSSDGGNTWTLKSTANASSSYSKYCFDLAVHPNDSDKLMVSALNITWSTDGGSSWTQGAKGHSDHHSHAYLNGNNGDDVLIGSDGGVTLHSFSNTRKATRINNGYKVTQFYAGHYGPTGDTWIAGTQDNGTHKNINAVHRKVYGGDGGYAQISQQNPNVAYFSTQRGNTYRTANFQANYPSRKTISNNTMIREGVSFINPFIMNLADDAQLYYKTNKGLWRTVDSGNTWSKVSNTTGIISIASSIEANPVVYTGRSSSRIERIENAATTTLINPISLTTNRPSLANGGTVLGIQIHPNNRNTIYVTYSNNSNSPRIWRIENCDDPAKLKWTNVSGNLPTGLPVNDIALHPLAPDSILFAATDFGLYYSTDSGTTWEKEMKIPSVAIFKIEMRATDYHAFLFTHGRGVWRITTTDLDPSTGIKENNKLQFTISPNPVKGGKLNIKLGIEMKNSKVKVIDMQGKVVKETVLQNNQSLNVSRLKAGMYFIKIINGEKIGMEKILILN